jgi:putative isomerase
VATAEQARDVARLHYRNPESFLAKAGVRTLAANEAMYNLSETGNPSNWLGPIWIVCNYLTFRGLVKYGLNDEARDLVERTVELLGRDLEKNGCMHEYYVPETGEPVMNPGFMNWNFLVLNMIVWAEGGKVVTEF